MSLISQTDIHLEKSQDDLSDNEYYSTRLNNFQRDLNKIEDFSFLKRMLSHFEKRIQYVYDEIPALFLMGKQELIREKIRKLQPS